MKVNNELKTWYYKVKINQDELFSFERFRILNLLETEIIWWIFWLETYLNIRANTSKKAKIILDSPFEINYIEEVNFWSSYDAIWMENQIN